MPNLIERLDALSEALGKATQGEWESHPTLEYAICLPDGDFIDMTRHGGGLAKASERDAIVLSVNFLRENIPTLREALRDAEKDEKHDP